MARCELDNADLQKCFMLLLNYGANSKIANNNGVFPIHYIVGNRKLSLNMQAEPLVDILLSMDFNPNRVDNENCTPLIIACVNRDWDICKQLLEAGGDMNIPCSMRCELLSPGQDIKNNGGKITEMVELGDCTTSDLMPRGQRSYLYSFICVAQSIIPSESRDRCMNCAATFDGVEFSSANDRSRSNSRSDSIEERLSLTSLSSITSFLTKSLGSGKHHCRHCARLVCQDCSPQFLNRKDMPSFCTSVSSEINMRVCRICYTILNGRNNNS